MENTKGFNHNVSKFHDGIWIDYETLNTEQQIKNHDEIRIL